MSAQTCFAGDLNGQCGVLQRLLLVALRHQQLGQLTQQAELRVDVSDAAGERKAAVLPCHPERNKYNVSKWIKKKKTEE